MISDGIIKQAREFSIKLLSNYNAGFTLRHTFFMIDLLEKIIEKLDKQLQIRLRKDIVEFSIILHDVGRTVNEKNHSYFSFDIIRDNFSNKISEEDIAMVKDCVINHSSGMRPSSFEAKLVQDLDKLSMLYPKVFWEYVFHVSKETTMENFAETIENMLKKNLRHFNTPEVNLMCEQECKNFIEIILTSLQEIRSGNITGIKMQN